MADDELYIELFIENEQLRTRIAELETALKRFADQACLSDELPKTDSVFVYVSDLRQARKVLGEKE